MNNMTTIKAIQMYFRVQELDREKSLNELTQTEGFLVMETQGKFSFIVTIIIVIINIM